MMKQSLRALGLAFSFLAISTGSFAASEKPKANSPCALVIKTTDPTNQLTQWERELRLKEFEKKWATLAPKRDTSDQAAANLYLYLQELPEKERHAFLEQLGDRFLSALSTLQGNTDYRDSASTENAMEVVVSTAIILELHARQVKQAAEHLKMQNPGNHLSFNLKEDLKAIGKRQKSALRMSFIMWASTTLGAITVGAPAHYILTLLLFGAGGQVVSQAPMQIYYGYKKKKTAKLMESIDQATQELNATRELFAPLIGKISKALESSGQKISIYDLPETREKFTQWLLSPANMKALPPVLEEKEETP